MHNPCLVARELLRQTEINQLDLCTGTLVFEYYVLKLDCVVDRKGKIDVNTKPST